MNWYKLAQLTNYLQQLGHTPNLISYVNSLPKNIQKGIGNFVNSNQNASEVDIKNFIQSFNPQNQNIKQSPIDIVFKNQNITKDQFFTQIPKPYVPFVSRILINKEKRPEDLQTILEVLNGFENIKQYNLPIEKDINKYTSFQQLQKVVIDFSTENKEAVRVSVDPRRLKGVTLYKQSGPYSIWKVSSEESLKQIGMGTKWCTRGDAKDCYAKDYLREHKSLYVVTKGSELIAQFTPNLDQVMNVLDNEIEELPEGLNLDEFATKTTKLQYVSKQLRNNYNFILKAVKKDGNALEYASDELRNNTEIVLTAVSEYARSFSFASDELKNNKEVVIEAVKRKGLALEFASEELKKDLKILLIAVNNNALSIQFASQELRNDPEVILKAIKTNEHCLAKVSDVFTKDPEFMLKAIKIHEDCLIYASKELKNNFEFALKAIKQNGACLRFFSVELRSNKELILESVKYNGNNLTYALGGLEDNEEIALAAVKSNPNSYYMISNRLKSNPLIAMEAINREVNSLSYCPISLKNNPEFMLKVIKNDNKAFQYATPQILDNYEVMLESVKQNGNSLGFASLRLRNNPEIALEAVKNKKESIQFVSSILKNNPDFMTEVNKILQEKQKMAKSHGWYKLAQQKLTPQQIGLYQQFKSPTGVKLIGSGLSAVFKLPGTNQSLNGSQLMNQVISRIQGVLTKNNVHTIDTSPVSRADAIGVAISSEPGTVHVDISKIFNQIQKQSLPSITQLDGVEMDQDVQKDVIGKISQYLTNQLANTAAHESQHNIDYFKSFPKGKFQSPESGAESFGNQIANQYFGI